VRAEPSPKPNPMDDFQSARYRLILLFLAILLAVGGGGRRNIRPWARSGRSRDATCASPMVPRTCVGARAPPHRWSRNFRLAARCLRMESPFGRTYAGILGQKGRLNLAGTVSARQRQRPRNLLCHPCAVSHPRTFEQAPVERSTLDAVAGRSRSSLPGVAPALDHDSIAASAG